ncbi:ABC transporter permease subunit [Halococcus sp. IIIV-5B]|uniref:ABC transporter permease subunit n=1 Tax=Halococcus sp. IIIV-5B TaxID=2321230 RepID=UPI000E7164C3|nr:ABC transporter permease subunit [Halococcus sp. IIIV-5B]RJT07037.1 nitrite reductase [Halococcus sp. IIIV-5B]
MRWRPLARKEAKTVLTTKIAWLLVPILVLWGFQPTYDAYDALGRSITAGYIQRSTLIFLPLCALLLGYQSIVGERTTRSIKFLLALPLRRSEVLLGKSVGRTLGVATITLVGLIVLGAVGLIEHGVFSLVLFVGTVLTTLVYVAALVSVAVAVSAVAKRTVVAATTVFGFFLVTLFWEQLVPAIYGAITGVPVDPYDPPASGPLFFALRLTPDGAYDVVTNWLFGVGNSAELVDTVYAVRHGVSVNAYVVDTAFADQVVPWYLHPALGVVILLGWIALPLGLAHLAFNRGDAW